MKHLFSATSTALDEGAAQQMCFLPRAPVCPSTLSKLYNHPAFSSSATSPDTSTEPSLVLSGLLRTVSGCSYHWRGFQASCIPALQRLGARAAFAFPAGSPAGTQLLDPLLFPGSRKVKRHLVLYLSQTRLWGGRKQVISSYMTRASIQCLCSRVSTALATLVGDVDNYFK